MKALTEYDFTEPSHAGLLICSGGFEDRSKAFVKRLSKNKIQLENALLLRYDSQASDNVENFQFLKRRLRKLLDRTPEVIGVDSAEPHGAYATVRVAIAKAASEMRDRHATVDISGMTQLLALCVIHA